MTGLRVFLLGALLGTGVIGCNSSQGTGVGIADLNLAAPSNLAANSITTSAITVTWSGSAGDAGYNILRNNVKVGSSTTTSYTDTGLTGATTYQYSITAYDSVGNTSSASATLSVATVTPFQALTVPTNLMTTAVNASSISFSFTASTASAGVAGYNIFRGGTKIGTTTTPSYTDSNLTPSTTYIYTASAFDAAGNTSAVSAPLSATTAAPVAGPTQVQGFMATESPLYCTVLLSYQAATDKVGVTGYTILRNGAAIGSTTLLTYNDTTAAAGTTYAYTVEAFNAAGGYSTPASTVSISTGSCTAAPAFRLGAIYTTNQTTFSIWSPDSADVALDLAGTLYPMSAIPDANGYTSVYQVIISGDQNLKLYNFQVNGVTSRDPYGVMVQPGTNNNIVMDPTAAALPGGWSPTPTLTNRVDSVIYETHVRDFTNDASSGLPVAQRSTYAGMTQAGTTINAVAGAPSTGIDHLVDMGVTHIQLMPVLDFNSCNPTILLTNPTCYNWGYDPENFNVPEERYSQVVNDPMQRVIEFKTMIDNFHKRGIRVVLDVVYNHTADKTVFGNISSKYYEATDITGGGNTINGAQPMVARLIQDSLDYLASEYNVDGFRFDLLGVFPITAIQQWNTYLNTTYPTRNLLLYGEPYTGSGTDPNQSADFRTANVGTIVASHTGAFNIGYRGALKNTQDNTGGTGGFIFNQDTPDSLFGPYSASSFFPGTTRGLDAISEGFVASPLPSLPAVVLGNQYTASYTAAPEQAINYVDVHDNLCLADKVTAWAAANGQSTNTGYLTRIQQYALSMVITSEGVPFLYGGSEFQRTKQGDSNSYASSDAVNDFNWNLLATNAGTYSYVKALIALRRAHPAFRFATYAGIAQSVLADQRSASLMYAQIDGSANNDTWKTAIVVFNSANNIPITLPAGNWTVVATDSSVPATPQVVTGTVTAPGTAITVLYQ